MPDFYGEYTTVHPNRLNVQDFEGAARGAGASGEVVESAVVGPVELSDDEVRSEAELGGIRMNPQPWAGRRAAPSSTGEEPRPFSGDGVGLSHEQGPHCNLGGE